MNGLDSSSGSELPQEDLSPVSTVAAFTAASPDVLRSWAANGDPDATAELARRNELAVAG